MRLWHEELIPYLPDMQLRGQHRECCALRGNGWNRPHSTVNYIFNYNINRLYDYHLLIMEEIERRGIANISREWYDINYRGKVLGYDYSISNSENIYTSSIYPEHNTGYRKECINNLKNKNIELNIKPFYIERRDYSDDN